MAAGTLRHTLKGLPVVGDWLTPVQQALRQPSALRRQRAYGGVLLFNTQPKSGSVYLKTIVGNYIWARYLGHAERIDFKTLNDTLVNQPADSPAVRSFAEATGYTEWRAEHDNPLIMFNNARTIVHTYRNPLDNFVSRYYWYYVHRDNPPGTPRHGATISDAIELDVPALAWQYAALRSMASRSNVQRIAYERLVRNPGEVGADVIRFCFRNDPVDADVLAMAVEASSADRVIGDEQRYGLVGANFVGQASTSFIRNGEIGEWRSVLDERSIRRIEEILAAHRISFDEFTLE